MSDSIRELFESDTRWYDVDDLRKELFKAAMNKHWEKVRELYREEKVQGEYITRANDTLLHVAVSGATEEIILDLLDIVHRNRDISPKILNIKNKTGDTPLHLAAALGLGKVCRRMAEICPDMVTRARNNLQETPLFSAVRHGKKNSFFELEVAIFMKQNLRINEDELCKRDITYCRRGDGNNILHYAIKGEQFDLAYEIIRLYPALVNNVNSNGETALHTLANKPSVFKSGTRFGLFDPIIYHCTITKPLTFQFVDFLENEKNNMENISDIIQQYDPKKVLPPNCTVCIDLNSLMKNSVRCIFNYVASNLKSTSICKPCCADEENQYAGARKENNKLEDEYKPSKRRMYCKYWRGQTIAKLKQKHGNALQIMEELVDRSTLWEYEEAGKEPDESSLPYDIRKSPPSVEIDQSYYIPNPSYKDETIMIGIDMDKNSLRNVGEKESTNRSDTESPVLVAAKKGITEMVESPVLVAANKGITEMVESPVLVAAKKGITEMVERILRLYPVAIFDQDKDSKNIVLLAVEHRRVHVYDYMQSVSYMESVFWKLDKEGNSALHLAAMLSDRRLWSTGAALHIQWEIKWYKYVRSSMGRERSVTTNNAGKMPEEVFIESHDALIKDGITGLTNTCQSCSVVATLFATVAFQSVSTVPGGVDQQSGFPILSKRPVFQLFAISSLLALCFSVTSVVMFLAILISDFKVWDFEWRLPVKLILGLTSLFMTIAFTLVAFCAGDFYVIESNLKSAAYPIYAIMCFPVTYFAVAQYPLYINLIKQTIKKVAKPEMAQDYIS